MFHHLDYKDDCKGQCLKDFMSEIRILKNSKLIQFPRESLVMTEDKTGLIVLFKNPRVRQI